MSEQLVVDGPFGPAVVVGQLAPEQKAQAYLYIRRQLKERKDHMAGNIRIRQTMRGLAADCYDAETGEVGCTQLAEMACHDLQDYDGDDVPERYFECAVDVAGEYERKMGKAASMPSALGNVVNSRDSSCF